MRRKRIDLKARGVVRAVERANVIGANDQRTTSGPAVYPHRQAGDMTVPTIIAPPQINLDQRAPSRHDNALLRYTRARRPRFDATSAHFGLDLEAVSDCRFATRELRPGRLGRRQSRPRHAAYYDSNNDCKNLL